MVVGIDASRNRSGGAIAHLLGILEEGDPSTHGIRQVHLWAYRGLLDAVPERPWLVKHHADALERSLASQVAWQFCVLPHEARMAGCSILLNTDAGSVCPFRPCVVISQDLLPYEPAEIAKFGLSKAAVRLRLLRIVGDRSMRRAEAVIFLSHHAAKTIRKASGNSRRACVIPHGVGGDFRRFGERNPATMRSDGPIRCLYVSHVELYKHQWVLVKAIAALRKQGHDLSLTLAGGGCGRAQRLLEKEIAASDPEGTFVRRLGFVPHDELPRMLKEADLFAFASSCESLPVSLLEAMAAGLPIACSNRGPMPEVLQDGGVYFDPEDAVSVAAAIEKIVGDPQVRGAIARRAQALSEQYTWARCAAETWGCLRAALESRDLNTTGELA